MKRLCLFTPYYLAEDYDRQQELDACLRRNVACREIDRIVLMIDDGHTPPIESDKIVIVETTGRPTYAQWLDLTDRHAGGAISILANSDMYVDETVALLRDVFCASPRAFVAISRYDVEAGAAVIHKNPHWSQDIWAIDAAVPVPGELRRHVGFQLGVPRCDNKISYLFSIYGYDVFNPCLFVRTYHLHETGVRSYDKDFDKRIMGGVAYAHPSEELTTPSRLSIDIWTLKPEPVDQARLNSSIAAKQKRAPLPAPAMPTPGCIVAYDRGWQYPAITEQHAFAMLRDRMDAGANRGVAYLAFPWASYIDHRISNRKDPGAAAFYKLKLDALKSRLGGAASVVTVCQHIHLLKTQDMMDDAGVTDVFWSHAVKGLDRLPDFPKIRLWPFPLYPVQAIGAAQIEAGTRAHLYSFVGARANSYYLTDTRNIIIEHLAKDPGALILANELWHYNRIVYDFQIRKLVSAPDGLVDIDASENFRRITRDSVFALCPSGTGPNSIRLWEAIGLGAIPVIISDRLALPGSAALWEEAAVFCDEDFDSILALPERLRAIYADPALVRRKRQAMRQIWSLYGADGFVTDVERLMLERIGQPLPQPTARALPPEDAPLVRARTPALDAALAELTTELLVSPETAAPRPRAERARIQALFAQAPERQRAIFERAIGLRGLQDVLNGAA